ncbi:MAG TPA: aldo/keto reductase [Candidatus Hydrogenedentes bacterium]|nr:aldo/keto reductase [Candidatus Hydrogenedentota bacterium]
MELRNLGASEVRVTPIGLGCWQFSGGKGLFAKMWATMKDVPFTEIVRTALEGGINWFDTAELYGRGKSEEDLSKGLQAAGKTPGEVVIATKWIPTWRTARSLVDTIEERKRRLNPYPIDLYQIHWPLSLSTIRAEMRAMAELVRRGDIRAVGISNYSAGQMRRAHRELAALGIPLATNQVQYSLLHRNIERNGVLETARELGITIIAFSPLAQGLLSGKFHERPELVKLVGGRKYLPGYWKSGLRKSAPLIQAMRRIGEKYGATPSQVALNWLVHFHGTSVVAIPGATKVYQAQDNVGALRFQLAREELEQLDELSTSYK